MAGKKAWLRCDLYAPAANDRNALIERKMKIETIDRDEVTI